MDHLEVQQAEEAAAEAEAERGGGLHLGGEAAVVELQLLDGVAQVLEVGGVDREQAAEDHRLGGLEAGQRLGGALALGGDGVADAGVADLLDRGGEEADLAGAEFVHGLHAGAEDADAVHRVERARRHHADAVVLAQAAVDDAHEDDNAEVGVVPAVDEHGLERRVGVALGGRQPGDDGLEHVVDAEAGLGGDEHGVGGVDADDVLDLLAHAVGFGGGEVDLVEDGDDLVAGVDRLVDVGERLRLDALGGVDHEERALDGAHRAGDLVGEVDVARRVDQVEDVGLAVLGGVVEPHGLRLDGDAALALDVHGVEQLFLHVAVADRAGRLHQAVGEGGLAMVDVRDDGEVADVGRVGHARRYGAGPRGRQAGAGGVSCGGGRCRSGA